jgi:hypothetical protein
MFNCCSHGTLLHFGPQGSHLSICYYHQDLHRWRLHAGLRPFTSALATATLLLAVALSPTLHVAGQVPTAAGCGLKRSSAIHFQGRLLRQVSCYTLLSRFRLPWPLSCCLKQATPLMVSYERPPHGHPNPAFGSSHSASSAYQNGPTGLPLISQTFGPSYHAWSPIHHPFKV